MILLIDNYDSFTFNLMHLIGGLGEEVIVERNDKISVEAALSSGAEAIVISPGPCTPNEAGICLDLVTAAAVNRMPLFGVCLGMQSIVQAFGGNIRRADKLMHGKTCAVRHRDGWLFENIPQTFTAARYHSLVAAADTMPERLAVCADAEDDQEIMAVIDRTAPIAGVQFHPESIAAEYGEEMLANFLGHIRK